LIIPEFPVLLFQRVLPAAIERSSRTSPNGRLVTFNDTILSATELSQMAGVGMNNPQKLAIQNKR
jgi:hypothetical protein